MPQVKVSRKLEGKKEPVFQAVKSYLEGRETLKKLGAEVDWNSKTCEAEIEGGNFKGSIQVVEIKGECTVEIVVDLPLLLTPFKGKVEEELKKHLSRVEV